eukprot:COSAG06_NODE_592_length_13946_cov_8.193302_11_plen_173_part_00
MIILPRQARDRHRENHSKTRPLSRRGRRSVARCGSRLQPRSGSSNHGGPDRGSAAQQRQRARVRHLDHAGRCRLPPGCGVDEHPLALAKPPRLQLRLQRQRRDGDQRHPGKKNVFVAMPPSILKPEHLPRLARDKHRESSKQGRFLPAVPAARAKCLGDRDRLQSQHARRER